MKHRFINTLTNIFSFRNMLVVLLALIIPAIIIYVYFALYTEEQSWWSMQCGFHALTGLQCPGCGGQRSLHFLLHGEIGKALQYNAFFVVGLPVFLYMYYLFVQQHGFNNIRHLDSFFYSSRFAKIVLVTIILFFILRNIPVEPFTYLSPPE